MILLKILGGLYLLGLMGMVVGWAWLRRRAFAEGLGWGLLCTFVPGGSLVFLARRWDDARDPFIASALGFACVLPLVLWNPVRFAHSVSAGLAREGWRGAVIGAAFPPEPAVAANKARRPDPWPVPVEEAEDEETVDGADPDAEPALAGPSDAFEREAARVAHVEQRQREARARLAQRRAEADALFRQLQVRRETLSKGGHDAAAVAAFNAEAARYAALLEQLRAQRLALEAAEAPAPEPALPPATLRPGVVRRQGGAGAAPPVPHGKVGATFTTVGAPATPRAAILTAAAAANDGSNALPEPHRAALQTVRATADAVVRAADAGPWAAEVYGTAAVGVTGPTPAPSPRR